MMDNSRFSTTFRTIHETISGNVVPSNFVRSHFGWLWGRWSAVLVLPLGKLGGRLGCMTKADGGTKRGVQSGVQN